MKLIFKFKSSHKEHFVKHSENLQYFRCQWNNNSDLFSNHSYQKCWQDLVIVNKTQNSNFKKWMFGLSVNGFFERPKEPKLNGKLSNGRKCSPFENFLSNLSQLRRRNFSRQNWCYEQLKQFKCKLIFGALLQLSNNPTYRRTSLYAIDRNHKICLAYNEFAYKKTKDDCKLKDTFYKQVSFSIAYMRICR